MDFNKFKQFVHDPTQYHADEVAEFEPWTDNQLTEYLHNLEHDGGIYSDWDHVQVLVTMKYRIAQLMETTVPARDPEEPDSSVAHEPEGEYYFVSYMWDSGVQWVPGNICLKNHHPMTYIDRLNRNHKNRYRLVTFHLITKEQYESSEMG